MGDAITFEHWLIGRGVELFMSTTGLLLCYAVHVTVCLGPDVGRMQEAPRLREIHAPPPTNLPSSAEMLLLILVFLWMDLGPDPAFAFFLNNHITQ